MRLARILDADTPDTGLGAAIDSRVLLAAGVGAAVLTLGVWLARSRWARRERVRAGGHLDIARCPVHGIAYDTELEQCTECAKTLPDATPELGRLVAEPLRAPVS